MSAEARETVLAALRRSLKRAPGDEAAVEARLSGHPRGILPARGQREHSAQVELFVEMAEKVQSTTARVSSAAEIPEALTDFLKRHNLGGAVKLAPHGELDTLPWSEKTPTLTLASGIAVDSDEVSLVRAFGGVAETGTLMLRSGAEGPTTLNFLPENHVVVIKTSEIGGSYEDVWDRLRALYGEGNLPRTVNCITGPSRTGDIEQTIQLGAHGPRRLHIILWDDGEES
ncbi:MAG: lactate utilization protein [Rhodovibrionaceae bacterium]